MKARDLEIGMSIHPPQFGAPDVIEDVARVIDVDGYGAGRSTTVILIRVGCGQTLFFRGDQEVIAQPKEATS